MVYTQPKVLRLYSNYVLSYYSTINHRLLRLGSGWTGGAFGAKMAAVFRAKMAAEFGAMK